MAIDANDGKNLKNMTKSGLIAAVLNFVVWGLGYYYLRTKAASGALFFVAYIAFLGAALREPLGILSALVLPLFISLALALDAFNIAKQTR